MKKPILVLVLLCLAGAFILQPLAAADAVKDYEPYQKDEFPIWSGKVRRAEIIFFGSMPITLTATMLGYNLAVNQFGAAHITPDSRRMLTQVGIAAGISLGIVLVDFILGEMQEK
ncbi:hypothetical protein [Parasphaerochaeta coccoides]|uniref:Uncharacterized protein n=1 Tax=Parasphaerochaeta coccoides (strain ATCC BAA-1237 / DSM 17374 / SPN1) TaxID=760011 RepID=F4GIH0_PARC1|nr:hypothetical protein [Parasphaerochaeta coccoides]AEC01678.1 hypothetical protein Spico_0450 [Parasphaerochaeta coccoides DSM 17374]